MTLTRLFFKRTVFVWLYWLELQPLFASCQAACAPGLLPALSFCWQTAVQGGKAETGDFGAPWPHRTVAVEAVSVKAQKPGAFPDDSIEG